jgi:hypothetical protein
MNALCEVRDVSLSNAQIPIFERTYVTNASV